MSVFKERWPSWVHEELCNWSRWCWGGSYPHPLPARRCASVEGNWTGFDFEAEIEDVRVMPNEDHALVVDRVWRSLPTVQRMALRAAYPQRDESGYADYGPRAAAGHLSRLLREMGQLRSAESVSPAEFDAALVAAVERVRVEFEVLQRSGVDRMLSERSGERRNAA